ncbi:hypothetical protein BofuT4_P088800.1 [Botrytis cinerea T4]|uniref:Uncharacterized protein n=1 Tax=Botryotinia fuckeliana (strain T4) TaxID=999810 RepID=G2YFD3_BOTF4|nr:hypothetical protein BofuT4_P088800.1 [Botrytis cinerea T4]
MDNSLYLTGCSNFPNDCGPLSADIEIEGVGIYISFLATALLTLSAAVIRLPCQLALHSYEYAEHARPEYHDFDHQSNKGTAANLYHAAKEKVRVYRRWILLRYSNKPNLPRYRLINAALTPLIISLADQQLVTSSAVMIAGLYNFHTISAYHYNIIVYLAWFSSFTHTVAFVSMGDHFLQNHILAGIRFCGYIGNFILFIFAQSRARSFGNTADEREKISDENREAGLPSHSSQWKHRLNALLKVTHLGKPPTAKDPGLRNRISTSADNNSVDHPTARDTERLGVIEMAPRQDSRLSQLRERQTLSPTSPRLFTNESGELVLLPHIKETSLGLDCVINSSR